MLRLGGGCSWATDNPRDKQHPSSEGHSAGESPPSPQEPGPREGEGRSHKEAAIPSERQSPLCTHPMVAKGWKDLSVKDYISREFNYESCHPQINGKGVFCFLFFLFNF